MRHPSLRLLAFAVPALLALSAAPAQAGFSSWSGLPGLSAPGSSWVREYTTGLPPTTIYAATEGSGVWRSQTDGVTWENFSSGLDAVPGALNVRTVYTSGLTAYAGTTAGLFKSVGGGWTPVAQGPEDDPKHPKKLNAAVQAIISPPGGAMLAGVASGGVYRSTDDGATWTPPAPDNGMARSETVWSFAELIPGVIFAATGSGIYRSINYGSSWTLSSDGISGTTLRVFADGHNPNIYYAATPGSGVYRSINAGITWSAANGAGTHQLGNGVVRALSQFSGVNETRLYAGTGDGMWAGTTGNGPLPGAVNWRKVTNDGLGNNTIFWALTNFTTTPGTMLAGTQSNGGYALTFVPPANTALPVIDDTTPVIGRKLTTTNGSWSGTQTIEFEYQWQRCTGTTPATCTVDIPDATAREFVAPPTPVNARYRVVVTASNDFPTFGKATAASAITGQTGPKPGTLPGDSQSSTASIVALAPGDSTLPQSGDTLHAQSWLFNPAATTDTFPYTTFQWFRCNPGCNPLPGATAQNYVLSDADVTTRLCVTVTGTNGSGSTTLGCSGQTNTIFPEAATQLVAAKLNGNTYVGDTLVSDVGTWKYPGTTYTRQWESCDADGSSCATISNEKSAAYVIRAADLGHRLRVRINADSNGSSTFPAGVEVFTPQSAVVTLPPVDDTPIDQPGPGGGGGGGGGGTPAPQPTPAPAPPPAPDKTAPVLKSLGAVAAKLKPNAALSLRVNLSEGGSLSVELQRVRAGRKQGKACKPGRKTGRKCTLVTKIATVKLTGPAGAGVVTLPKRKLAAGDYRAVVTPIDAAGNRGAARTVTFKVTKR